jgi:hypothetical protein
MHDSPSLQFSSALSRMCLNAGPRGSQGSYPIGISHVNKVKACSLAFEMSRVSTICVAFGPVIWCGVHSVGLSVPKTFPALY